MANRAWMNFGRSYTNLTSPNTVHCNFIVDSANGNNLGMRSLKSNGYVKNVFMNVQGAPPGSPAMGTARSFAILGAASVTNVGSSVLTGNLGVTPGTSITGFPPGTFSGQEHIADLAAANAKASAQAAYTAMQAKTPTGISSQLDGQSLTAGVYKATSGTAGAFTLDAAGGALTLTGSATDIFIFQTDSTLITGTTGAGVMTLVGVKPANVYWVVGSSATLNSGTASEFSGNVIALTSITDTIGGTTKGSLIALNGTVALSAASTVIAQPSSPSGAIGANPNPVPGIIWVQLADNYARSINGIMSMVSPLDPANITVLERDSALVVGQPYVIVLVGTTTAAEWHLMGVPAGVTPAVGVSFIALITGTGAGSGLVRSPLVSGIDHMEIIGDPNVSFGPQGVPNQGAWIMLQCLSNNALTAPADNTVVALSFILDSSSVNVDGL